MANTPQKTKDATEAALRIIEETKFPVQQMVSHVFPLAQIENCIRAIGGEVPGTFPTKLSSLRRWAKIC